MAILSEYLKGFEEPNPLPLVFNRLKTVDVLSTLLVNLVISHTFAKRNIMYSSNYKPILRYLNKFKAVE